MSGYDRGHLAAAANHRSSQDSMCATFFLSNMSPQVGEQTCQLFKWLASKLSNYGVRGPLALASPFACGSRVTSCESPRLLFKMYRTS